MAKRKGNVNEPYHQALPVASVLRSSAMANPVVPTGDARHISHIRHGRISFEDFSKARLALIPIDFDVVQVVSPEATEKKSPTKEKLTKKEQARQGS